MKAKRFARRTQLQEAIRYDGTRKSATRILHWMFPDIEPEAETERLVLTGPDWVSAVAPGDWVVKQPDGGFMTVTDFDFRHTFAEVR